MADTSAKRSARTMNTPPRTNVPAKVAPARRRTRNIGSRQVGLGRNKQDLRPVEVSVGPPSGDDRMRSEMAMSFLARTRLGELGELIMVW